MYLSHNYTPTRMLMAIAETLATPRVMATSPSRLSTKLRLPTRRCSEPRLLAARSDSTTLPPVITMAGDVVAVEDVEAAEVSMTEEVAEEVAVAVVALVTVAVEARAAGVETAPTVGALETSRARSRLSLKSAMALP
jgi:hypothetical protein